MSKRNLIGVDHSGRMNAIARDGEATHSIHHTPAIARGMEARTHTRATLGVPPKAKGYAVPIHNGMTERQQALKGMQHANPTAPDANPASPLSKEPAGKPFVGKPVAVVPGQRSRTSPHNSALGAAILAEAFSNSACDDRMAHGINPILPGTTKEN
jgi:hypothetical protein